MDGHHQPRNQQPTRRSFLDILIAGCSALAAAAMAIPAGLYLWPAAKGGGGEKVEVEGAKSLPVGGSKMVQLGSEAVIVVHKREGFAAYSAVCTHLGCLVKWNGAKGEFSCPCHAAVFGPDGEVVSGPPPAPLPKRKVQEVGDKVFVSKA